MQQFLMSAWPVSTQIDQTIQLWADAANQPCAHLESLNRGGMIPITKAENLVQADSYSVRRVPQMAQVLAVHLAQCCQVLFQRPPVSIHAVVVQSTKPPVGAVIAASRGDAV